MHVVKSRHVSPSVEIWVPQFVVMQSVHACDDMGFTFPAHARSAEPPAGAVVAVVVVAGGGAVVVAGGAVAAVAGVVGVGEGSDAHANPTHAVTARKASVRALMDPPCVWVARNDTRRGDAGAR
jgi:hypothetical protein